MPVIRPARLADLPQVADIWVRSWQAAYAGIVPAAHLSALDPRERHGRLVERFTSDPRYEMLVADSAATLLGFVVGGPWRGEDAAPEIGELAAIYLAPEHRGRGVGRLLLDAAERRLAERGFAEVRLWVLEDNTSAQRFYRGAGWAPDGLRQTYDVGGAALPELRYAHRLVPHG